jgi:hypothetical protein
MSVAGFWGKGVWLANAEEIGRLRCQVLRKGAVDTPFATPTFLRVRKLRGDLGPHSWIASALRLTKQGRITQKYLSCRVP